MNAKRLRTGVAAAMGGAVLLAGLLVGASIAFAEDGDATVTDITTDGDAVERCHDFFRDRAGFLGGNLDELAAEFGTSLEELEQQLAAGATLDEVAADLGVDLDSVLTELREKALSAIDERVAAGDLTREQGDAIKERIESFDPGAIGFGPHGFSGPMPERSEFGRGFGDLRGLFGDLDLGIDLSELRDSLESGMSLDEALDGLGIDLDTIVSDAQQAALDHLDELVADGTLTQERADEIKGMIEGFDLSEGLPFNPRGFRFDLDGFDLDGFDFDRFHGPRGHGFFGGEDLTDDANAEGAVFSA